MKNSTRFQVCIPAVVLPLFIPIVLLLIWHVQNHRWPNDDAANYATTAYEIYDRFQSQGAYQGLLALRDLRGWRPILFPTLMVPYLLVFQGNIPLAVGGVLGTLYCLLTFYAYQLCQLFLPQGRAVIAAALVTTSPFLVQFATMFSRSCRGCALRSHGPTICCGLRIFESILHSSLAGIFLALIVVTRSGRIDCRGSDSSELFSHPGAASSGDSLE